MSVPWDVWKVCYMTYEDIERFGDRPRERIARGLSLAKALELVDQKGFGYSAHQELKRG